VDEARATKAVLDAFAEFGRLEQLQSTWIASSEVSRINAAAGREAIAVGPDTARVIEESLWIASKSDGVFDITFEAMKGLWKFDEGAEDRIPTRAAIEGARRHIDWRNILFDKAAGTVKLRKPETRINLGGIAKGYAVDAASRILEQAGLRAYFVQAGGDLYVRGRKPDGSRFRVGIRDPRGKNAWDYFAMIEVEDHAFSTAGDYERSFLKDGKRYHHILDPRTGFPSERSASVTVISPTALWADAVDTAVFILGPRRGIAALRDAPGGPHEAIVVDPSLRLSATPGSERRLVMRATLDAAHRLGDWTEGDVTITVPPRPPPTDGP
jgi:thiamine biosynthesis lipoprotein